MATSKVIKNVYNANNTLDLTEDRIDFAVQLAYRGLPINGTMPNLD